MPEERMSVKSKALEVNLSDTKADVTIDERYHLLLVVFSGYVGILNRLEVFLKELSHPYRNWEFIVAEARHFSLHYFYLYKSHEDGANALGLFFDILASAFHDTDNKPVKTAAADNLMLVMHHTAKESNGQLEKFLPILEHQIRQLGKLEDPDFFYVVSLTKYPTLETLGCTGML